VHGTIEPIFRVEWRPLIELGAIGAQWRELAGRALEPNVFYEPSFALAAAPVLGDGVGAGLVWSRSPAPRLLGFFPARIDRRRYGIPLAVLVGWTHPYGPLGAPLVDREMGEAVIGAWLDHVSSHPQLPKLMLLPYFPEHGALAQALDAVLARRGGGSECFARHARALLVPVHDRAHYLDEAIGHKKRKELRRQRNRLSDAGTLTSSSTGDSSAIARALDDFLTLEAGGWKGRAGTAARSNPDIVKFMATAVAALAGEGKAQIGRLCIDPRPIAATITLRSGASAWSWKIAYDEGFARLSPGVQLLLDVTQTVLDDPAITRADSCATADHPMIDHIWRERLTLTDRLLCGGPGTSLRFALACRLESLRLAAIGGAKALRDRLRGQ
jgi:hypothetical protein